MKIHLKVFALILGSWGFINFAYWASHKPEYSWVFDVNATFFTLLLGISLFGLLMWIIKDLIDAS